MWYQSCMYLSPSLSLSLFLPTYICPQQPVIMLQLSAIHLQQFAKSVQICTDLHQFRPDLHQSTVTDYSTTMRTVEAVVVTRGWFQCKISQAWCHDLVNNQKRALLVGLTTQLARLHGFSIYRADWAKREIDCIGYIWCVYTHTIQPQSPTYRPKCEFYASCF